MNPLRLIGGPWSSMCFALLVGVAVGGTGAWKLQNLRQEARAAKDLREARRMDAKREDISAEIGRRYEAARNKTRTVTVTLIKEVDRYVPASDCPVSGGFRVFHDAAASNTVPDPASIPDAAAATAKEVAETLADNYGTCHDTADRLIGLQEWVRQQQRAK